MTVSSISGTTVTGALSDTVIVTGSITDRQSDDDTAYSGIRDSSIRVYRKSGSQEQAKAILYRDMSESTSRPLDTTKYENGTYILRLTIEDEAGSGSRMQVMRKCSTGSEAAAAGMIYPDPHQRRAAR